MALVHSTRNSGFALVRYFASVLFAIAVIVIGLKIAVDHWPCEFLAKSACTSH
jgi:hypothetical protein